MGVDSMDGIEDVVHVGWIEEATVDRSSNWDCIMEMYWEGPNHVHQWFHHVHDRSKSCLRLLSSLSGLHCKTMASSRSHSCDSAASLV
ncbi:hypothetical protein E3N88_09466 [Mikania micrantha]|uniref:Uncharacterized protein n=1 Tax=Mikania micrantha TaxID=192012 RepID=A0A5N6PJ43_9ASTR|nr:hypothetical protein E3N88_09466 [Mikania micrantha]